MMTQDRFEDLAGLYGPDIQAWPEPEQAAARAYLAAEPALAQAALNAEHELDALLDAAPAPAPDPALYDAVIASGVAARASAPRWAPMAAAAALVLGVSGGWLVSAGQMPVNGEEALYSTAFSVLAEEETDWLEEAAR
ncbi:hypothetical protein F1654_04000 [Alkalicaulis satelles]|uniref:Uncharacterized protein n=1 Tax=Alkalicaulis satelles TaxID=2609175 RepID=A0A5M6ZN79_9PROT|nr:hypothetical protein [Alkalicaulis satelles]KAA5805157.1 hypothetical protein F1654_04000 [Alkalicaulis satelles]